MDNNQETSTENPQLTPEQIEKEKKRLLRFCNALFDTNHETLKRIIMHDYNYEFVFVNIVCLNKQHFGVSLVWQNNAFEKR